jgi:hypothetical protein
MSGCERPAGTAPGLDLTERAGAVVEVDRHGLSGSRPGAGREQRVDVGPDQVGEGHAAPAEGGRVHDPAVADRAGHADADAEHRVRFAAFEHFRDAGADQPGDFVRVQPGADQRVAHRPERPERAVEQADFDVRLADVDAHDVPEVRPHGQQRPGPPAVGFDRSGLRDDAVRDELGDHVRNGGGRKSRFSY